MKALYDCVSKVVCQGKEKTYSKLLPHPSPSAAYILGPASGRKAPIKNCG